MSSGPFVSSKYQDDNGEIHPIRVQPETIAATGAAPAGNVDNSISARVGGSRRQYGLHARGLRLVRVVGAGDTAFKRSNFLPVLTTTAFGNFNKGGTLDYGGFSWTITKKVPEEQI